MESEIWASFQASRGANATLFIGIVIAIWVAARFASVLVEKDAPVLGRVLSSIFSLSVLLFGWNMTTNIMNQWTVHANALGGLGENASEIAKGFTATYGGEYATMPDPIGIAFLVSGFLIAFLPLWVKAKK
jgi:hypothetical protein|tara:strand:- start:18 stop:410 length:393 start_codon:yes stop_codon:yes gene_type:complete